MEKVWVIVSMACRGYLFTALTCIIVQQATARRAAVVDTRIMQQREKKLNPTGDDEDGGPLEDSMRKTTMSSSSRMSSMRMSEATIDASHGQTPEQVIAICGKGINTEVAWAMDKQEGKCTCMCDFDECSVKSCPDGYDWEGSECVKYEITPGEIIPAKEEKLECPGGSFTTSNGEHVCEIPLSCPELPKSSGQGVFRSQSTDCGTCKYDVSCDEPASIQMKESAAVCYTAEKKLPDNKERLTAEVLTNCPVGTEINGDDNCVRTIPCPIQVLLTKEALACGPQEPDHLEKLLDLIDSQSAVFKKHADHPKKLSCVASCYALFAKFAECVQQDDAGKCAGRSGKSGKGLRAIGALGHPDKFEGAPWLKKTIEQHKTKNKDDANPTGVLPCKDMYGSDIKLGDAWTAAAKQFEELANNRRILLLGDYMRVPKEGLDCRRTFCEKVDKRTAATGKPGRSLSQCLSACESY